MTTTRWLFALTTGAAAALLTSCSQSNFDPPQRLGPPALVTHAGEPHLWLLVKREEQRTRGLGGSTRSGRVVTEILFHFDLQSHDTHTAERKWKRRLLTLKMKESGTSAEARILGQDGDVVWLFLNDQPVAISSADGSILANREQIEQRNPALRTLMPKELKFYTFDGSLIITAADSRRYKVRVPGYAAEPFAPANEEVFQRLEFMSSTWNGGYRTADFLTRMATLGGSWLGFYTEKEAADAGEDGFGDHLKSPENILHEGSRARRTFWRARIGKTKEFSEGTHDRLFDVTKISGAPDFLEAGFFIKQGTKQALDLHDPEGLLVLHRTRVDEEGRLALTRLDENLGEKWTAKLPFTELRNRLEFSDRLLMYGAAQLTERGVTGWQESIVALELSDGRTHSWNVTLERGN